MSKSFLQQGLLWLFVSAGCLAQSPATVRFAERRDTTRTVSLAEYQAELDKLVAYYKTQPENDCCARPDDAIDAYIVEDGDAKFQVRMDFLPARYMRDEDDKTSEDEAEHRREYSIDAKKKVLKTLAALQNEAIAPAADTGQAAATAKANEILARPEYRRVRVPGMTENWRDRILRWISEMFNRLEGKTPNIRIISRTLLWILLGVALILLGFLCKRILERQEEEMSWRLGGAPVAVSSRSWQSWLKAARSHAAAGDWRAAIRDAYWAGISSLEGAGAWRPDRARTPREYLRLMESRHPHRSHLQSMTQRFELAWYANRPADEAGFADMIATLEEIGCR